MNQQILCLLLFDDNYFSIHLITTVWKLHNPILQLFVSIHKSGEISELTAKKKSFLRGTKPIAVNTNSIETVTCSLLNGSYPTVAVAIFHPDSDIERQIGALHQ